jgi:3-phosphoshikimate 1-carboxyvinyltransferase
MVVTFQPARTIRGEIRVPGDKSIAHRALILGAVALGRRTIEGLPVSEDVRSTMRCLELLGARFETEPDAGVCVYSLAPRSGARLDAGNSGTTARLLSGLAAGRPLEVTIDGDASLKKRPMERVAEPLRKMGASVTTAPGGTLPITVRGGALRGIAYRLPVPSAQVKSAILIAGLAARGITVVEEPLPTRDHTERMLRAMGAPIRVEKDVITLEGPFEPRGVEIRIPGDISSGAFFAAAAACLSGSDVTLRGVGVNPTRMGFLDALSRMGARVDRADETFYLEEPVADLRIRSGGLSGISIAPEDVPSMIDEIPLLAVAATQAEGDTVIRGARELRAKETDRIDAVAKNLSRMGARVETFDDGLVVRGPARLKGAAVDSFGDHRIAMAMAVAALFARGETAIKGSESVAVSYPGFFDDLRRLTV